MGAYICEEILNMLWVTDRHDTGIRVQAYHPLLDRADPFELLPVPVGH